MAAQQSTIETVQLFVKEVQEQGIHLKRAILFGSAARNQQTEYSDIDVALVSDDFTGVGFIDIPRFVKALRNHYIIQPKTFTIKDFQSGDVFAEEIKRTGIEISI